MASVRLFENADWPAVWELIEPVFRAGDTYAFPPDLSEPDAHNLWIEIPQATFVVEADSGEVLGTYYIKPNALGPGAHVCNCGYIVSESARGQGLASAMCEHSQQEAIARGFRCMQFNMVVATNEGAIRLWKRHGYAIVGTLPGAYRHAQLGFVDAHVMFKTLVD